MTRQTNLYYPDPELVEHKSAIVAMAQRGAVIAVALRENIFRAGGGGEPDDRGLITDARGRVHAVRGLMKSEGLTWLLCDADGADLKEGDNVSARIDAPHRARRRKLHTATHLCIRAACNHFGPVNVLEADIDAAAEIAVIRARAPRSVDDADIAAVDITMRSEVVKGRRVEVLKAKSLEEAEATYGVLLRVSDRHAFQGKVRLIHIEGFDLNPCSGLHHSTSNIGPYRLDPVRAVRAEDDDLFHVEVRLAQSWPYWYGEGG